MLISPYMHQCLSAFILPPQINSKMMRFFQYSTSKIQLYFHLKEIKTQYISRIIPTHQTIKFGYIIFFHFNNI